MSTATPAASPRVSATPVVIDAHRAMAWLMGTTVLAMMVYYFLAGEQGAVSVFAGAQVHEFVHDARHFLGFPCH